jgi:TonB family protein
MAMRWWSCSLALLVALAACVSSVTRYYVPTPGQPRYDTAQATKVLEQYLGVQCPERLAAKQSDNGEVRVTVKIDAAGAVTSAQLTTSTGDETLDGLFGTVAAQMKVDPPPDMQGRSEMTGRMRMGYSCSPSAAVATIQLVP